MKKKLITSIFLIFAFFYTKSHSSDFDIKAKTVIEEDCWIASRVTILPGVTIKK